MMYGKFSLDYYIMIRIEEYPKNIFSMKLKTTIRHVTCKYKNI